MVGHELLTHSRCAAIDIEAEMESDRQTTSPDRREAPQLRTVASREEAPPALIQLPPHGSFTLRAARASLSVSAGATSLGSPLPQNTVLLIVSG